MYKCLKRLCDASGQKICLTKSRVYFSSNVDITRRNEVCSTLNIEGTSDIGMYLGMPTLTNQVTRDTFGYLCKKIDRRLAGWKSKYLSLARRITLAKSTISAMASYAMQMEKIPRSICDNVDKRTRRFVWGGN